MKKADLVAAFSSLALLALAASGSACGSGGAAASGNTGDGGGVSGPEGPDDAGHSDPSSPSPSGSDSSVDDPSRSDDASIAEVPPATTNPAADGGNLDASTTSESPADGGKVGPATMPTMLPTVTGTCPTIADTNGGSAVLTFAGQAVTVWAGAKAAKPGPIVIYWYSTGGTPSQATVVLTQAGVTRITGMGGMVVAQNQSTKSGTDTTDNIWYSGDLPIADEVVACAIKQGYGDPSRIHVLGYSAGAMQTVYMWAARSGYVASVVSYSGGDVGNNKAPLQDPSNSPPAVAAHGSMTGDVDYLGINMYTDSHTWESDVRMVNGFVIDCGDTSTHTDITTRTKIAPEALQFFLDHPFKTSPEPYASGLPSGWPSYCAIVK